MFELPGGDQTTLSVTQQYAEEKLNKATIKKLKAVILASKHLIISCLIVRAAL